MKLKKSRQWLRRKFTCYLVLLAMLFSMAGGAINPAPAYADHGTVSGPATSLTIKVGTDASSNPTTIYTTLRTFSEEEMTDMATKQETYSYFDSMPTPVMDAATGVPLADLLDEVGIDLDDVNRFYFYTTDITTGFYKNITKADLYDEERYYFPLIDDSWDYDTKKPAESGEWGDDPTAGKVPVEPMLAVSDNWLRVLSAGEPDFDTQDTSTRYRLLNGQSEADYLSGKATAPTSAKWVHEIDVRLKTAPVTGVTLDQSAITLAPGESEQLTAAVAPSYASNDAISWSSDNPSVAAVNSSGLVTGVAGGNATITVTTTDGGFTATCAVTVEAEEPGLLTPPALTADTTGNTVGQAVDITFTDDETWRTTISGITVNGTPLSGEQYTVTAGNINIAAGAFDAAGDYSIVITATGYEDASVTQAIQEASVTTYSVAVDSAISGGSVAVDPTGGAEGTTVTVTVTPDEGKRLVAGSLKYNDGSSDNEITATGDVYSFALPAADVTITAQFEKIPVVPTGVWDGSVDVSWYNTTDTTFYIDTPAKLAGLAAIVNGTYNTGATVTGDPGYIVANVGGGTVAGPTDATWIYGADDFTGKTVYLTADLDMGGVYDSGSQTWSGPNYMPIGGQYCMTYQDGTTLIGSSWNGTFDGQGHTVKNIYCSRHAGTLGYSFSQSIGLIGRMGVHDNDPTDWYTNPSVKNVAVTGYIYGNRSIGGIVGKNGRSNGSVIENCLNYASVSNTDSKGCGGIAGAGWNSLTIKNCANLGNIYTSYKNAGGISGSCEATVINCYNVGYVGASTASQAQSLGTNNDGAVWTNCYWLDGSSASNQAVWGGTTGSTITQMMTPESMKTADFLTALNGGGNGWVADTNNVNSGYPVPNWQGTPGPETYNVTVDSAISGGTVSVDPANGSEGDAITVTVTPDSNKQLLAGSLKYNDGSSDIEITATEGVYSFVLPAANVTVTAQFEDVSAPSYDITKAAVPDPIWTVTVDKTTAEAGETVTVTVADTAFTSWATGIVISGNSGATYDFATVTAATGNATGVNGAGVYSFVMPAEPVTVGFTADYTPLDVYIQYGAAGEEIPVHSYTRAEIEALAETNTTPIYYAMYDRMPAVFMGKAVRYVTLEQLAISANGYNSDVRFNDSDCTLRGSSLDGWTIGVNGLSWDYLNGQPRKYYAGIGDQYLAPENRTGLDREVPAVLAITGWAGRQAQVDNQPYDTLNTYRFFCGQTEAEYGNGVLPTTNEDKNARSTANNISKMTNKIVFVAPETATTNYNVNFSVTGDNGTLGAAVDSAAISSGDAVAAGKTIVFTAAPAAGYQVKQWTVDSQAVADNKTNTLTVENLASAKNVTVEFEAAGESVTVAIGTVTAAPGEEVVIPITITNIPAGTLAVNMPATFSHYLLEFVGMDYPQSIQIANSNYPDDIYLDDGWAGSVFNAAQDAVGWTNSVPIADENLVINTRWRVSPNAAPGVYPVYFGAFGSSYGCYDVNFEEITAAWINGSVTVTGSGSGRQIWYMHNTDIGDGNLAMKKTLGDQRLAIKLSETPVTWISDQAANSDVTFPNGDWAAHLVMTTLGDAQNPHVNYSIQVGESDGTNFNAFNTMPLTGSGPDQYQSALNINIPAGGTVPASHHLALQISGYGWILGGAAGSNWSYFVTPSNDPGYPGSDITNETPPTLTADSTGNTVGQAADITFPADAAWEAAISGITVNGTPLTGEQYTVTAGNINIAAGAFSAAGDYIIIVTATGYEDAVVTQTMTANGGPQVPVTLSLSKSAASTGETITASGTGPANTWISMKVLDAGGNIVVFDAVKSDSQGNYTITFGVPAAEGEALNVITGFGTNIASATLSLKLDPPALTADTSNNVVGQSIDVTFSPDTDWQAAISGITVNGNSLTSGQFNISDGNINITAVAFSSAGDYTITVAAEGYKDAQVTQAMLAKTPPALVPDSTDNTVGQAINLTFAENADWQAAISGITVGGSPLTADQYTVSAGNINIAAVAFSAAGSCQIIVSAANYADAAVVQQILGIAPVLTSDITNNSPGQAIEITFADNEAWRNAITDITIDGVSIAGKYTAAAGEITLDNTVFTSTGSFSVVVKATGYADAAVTQGILNPSYLITPAADQIYVISEDQYGTKVMTVNAGVSGMKYFNVGVTPVRSHNGKETLVFVHLRDELQRSLNTSRGDFDLIDGAGAGFNVSAGDIVKVYMVDQLTNDINFNPTIFQ